MKISFTKYVIPFSVFITGACVLIIEIIATRVLSPYFGNTIFSLSSVLSVVLLALSLGYFFGGKLADKYPKEELFFGLIALSGLCVIVLHIMGMAFLSSFGYRLSIVQGPIIASALLFFLQSFLLGMLSPFAVKLQSARQEALGIGAVSGQIFFWSTLGSIVGSLSAGFLLIPHFGVNNIILTVGFLLIILGGFYFIKLPVRIKSILVIVAIIFCFLFIRQASASLDGMFTVSKLYSADALYQKVVIYEGLYADHPARFLFQDRNSSAAAFIDSDDLAYEYTKYYAVYKVFNPNIKQAFMVGGGAYSVPKALLHDVKDIQIDVAEIEPSLFDLAKQYFNVPGDMRLHNIVEDGRRLLFDAQKKYDLIFSDAYSSVYSTPSHLTTQEFFTLAKSKLNDKGIFMANVIGSLEPKTPSLALSEIKTFKSVFPNSYFFAVDSPNSQTLQNIIFIGYNSDNRIDFSAPGITRDKNPIIANLAKKQIDISAIDFSFYPLLTDDFSPIEYLTAKEL